MVNKIILSLYFISTSLSCLYCNTTAKEDYIKFKYNGIQYSGGSVWFRIYSKNECIIGSSKVATDKIFGIIISLQVEEAKIYPIYNSNTEKIIPDIWIRFDGDSSIKKAYNNPEKIGELRITENTDSRLSGFFKCELEDGKITEGEFSVSRTHL